MRGSIRKRTNAQGKDTFDWVVTIGYETRSDGSKRRVQKWGSGYKRRKDAETDMNAFISKLATGSYVEPSKQTLSEHVEEWLASPMPKVRPTTRLWYGDMFEWYVLPTLGSRKLRSVRSLDLADLYARLQREPARNGKPLAASSVGAIHAAVNKCFGWAVDKGKIERSANPAQGVEAPSRKSEREMQTWEAEELRRFLESTEGKRQHPLWMVAATTGMRRGELLGLRWDEDVDLERGALSVRQTRVTTSGGVRVSEPKTKRSNRAIALAPEAVAALRSWKARQSQERLAAGPLWEDTGLVFTRENGGAMNPDVVSKTFARHSRAAGIRKIRFHDLRHTFATLALKRGIPPKVVSEILGHHSVLITLDIYSHVDLGMQEDAATRVAAMIFGTTT